MKRVISFILVLVMGMTLFTGCGKKTVDQFSKPKKGETVAEIVIEGYGSIFVKFFNKVAPKAVENFVTHAKDGYYNGLTFHRIFNDFMIQGGDPKGDGTGGESIWGENFEDEFSDDLQPYRGALCMANSGPNTNGSQFFIVQCKNTYTEDQLKDSAEQTLQYYNVKVDFNKEAVKNYAKVGGTPWLYRIHTVFGQVYDGYDVLDKVAAVEVDKEGKPAKEVKIKEIKISEYK